MTDNTCIGERLRQLRIEKGLTQAKVAEQTGLKTQAIRYYEKAYRAPNFDAMVALERFFGVSGAYLRGETDQRQPAQASIEAAIADAVQKGFAPVLNNLLDALRESTELQQKMTFDILVNLLHVLQSGKEFSEEKDIAVQLLQRSFTSSTIFLDTCVHAGASPELEKSRLDNAREWSLENYQKALLDAQENLANKIP